MAVATLSPAADGNANWRRTKPVTLSLSATDDVAVEKFQYSLDGGATYVDVPVTPGPSVSATVPITQEGNTTVRYRAVDSSGNSSRGATANTTLNQASAAGATAIRLASTTGRSAGDLLLIDTGANQETATIASIVSPAPPSPAPNVTLAAPLANAHAAAVAGAATATYTTIAVLIDTFAALPNWATQATTLQSTSATPGAPAAVPGDTHVRLAGTTGRAAGDVLVIDQGANAETVTIASLVDPPPAAPAANVVLSSALTKTHLVGAAVYVPAILEGKILQSKTLTPLRTDPRRRDATDTVANGSGGSAIRRMEVDGRHVIPFPLALNRLTVGKHTQAVALQDAAGNALEYTQAFVVTTSFDDLDAVLAQYAANALNTTLNGATAVGATGLRLASPYGFRAGQTLVIDSGANQETVTVARAPSPPPTLATALTAPAAAGAAVIRLANLGNVNNPPAIAGSRLVIDTGASQELVTIRSIERDAAPATSGTVTLTEPLAKDHAAGVSTTLVNVVLGSRLTLAHASGAVVSNPRPFISAAAAANLRALVAQAKAAAGASNTAGAIAALQQFNSAVYAQVIPSGEKAAERAALTSAARALIDQLKGDSVDTSGTGITTSPWASVIRIFTEPTPFTATPGATYKVLVNGHTRGFRHEHIVDTEAMVQQLGAANGFDVEIWDPNLGLGPGRQAPAGVLLTENPLLDLSKLMQYKTLVFASTVGTGATGMTAAELANLQAYVRAGGGFVAIHGATDSMQGTPWYMDLVGAGFTNHGGNAGGIMPDCGACGEVELINADPAHATTEHLPSTFTIHEELYNTNRNPVELGIVHPLVLENESTLVGQIGYGTGSLMNSDRHGMVWCRNFDGGRSFNTVIGHSWQLIHDSWYRQQLLKAIQTTAGVEYGNCVTFNEVSELLAVAVAAGNVSGAGNAALSSRLASAKTDFDQGKYGKAIGYLEQFVAQTKKPVTCGSGCPDQGAALGKLTAKGQELIDWAKGLR